MRGEKKLEEQHSLSCLPEYASNNEIMITIAQHKNFQVKKFVERNV